MIHDIAIALTQIVGLCTLVGFVITMILQSKIRSVEVLERMKKDRQTFFTRFRTMPLTKHLGPEELEYYGLYMKVAGATCILGFIYMALRVVTK